MLPKGWHKIEIGFFQAGWGADLEGDDEREACGWVGLSFAKGMKGQVGSRHNLKSSEHRQ